MPELPEMETYKSSGDGKDRHASIFGAGYTIESQFDQFIKIPQLKNIPFVLKTHKE